MPAFLPLAAILLPSMAAAASPSPDRPSVSRTGHLVTADTAELELGTTFGSGLGAPALVKYSLRGAVEPRVAFDLVGIGNGSPGLQAGSKFAIVENGDTAFALHANTAVPIGPAEGWSATADALFTTQLSRGPQLQINGGILLVPSPTGSIGFGGIPVATAVGGTLTGNLSGFVEGAVVASDAGFTGWVADAGLGWAVTEIAVLDAGFGWYFALNAPIAQLGITVNFGRVGG